MCVMGKGFSVVSWEKSLVVSQEKGCYVASWKKDTM